MNSRFVSQENELEIIKTQDLICKDCVFRDEERSGICTMFSDGKPGVIFDGICNFKKTEG